ncbi:phosphonate ABC transporter, permease protein PhnE [Vagococcus xieshaowenii]|uniref:Phosphonate ABC transporter, permease protein PhnE n=1 Tax=Vagococcus xieshaowenii TaxID=2562451 RepID=A0A4Z0D144_9ENTE|nr:phosphonate ABC transporter, permease protein PhnE [Vagococcus xieshaowenii]QCA27911.1 phosphonate ABC transporter, permease protein PhnE [Vagococcus xieshaowenii]TFZ39461.1 phosphonate ABC transporter, permease protein PhnE [Vagococcus xieshaowenii]
MSLKETVHFKWYKHLFVLIFLLVCFQGSAWITEAEFSQLFQNSNQMVSFLSRFVHPDFSYLPKLFRPMMKTLQMSLLGTMIGLLFAVPVSFLATTIVTENRLISTISRFLLGLIRTIPTLLLAALLVAIFGIGEATGVLTIAVFTFGMVSQLMFQAIETIDYGPIEAASAVGANKIQIAIWSIAPQILSQFTSYAFYAFEVNVRSSTVLGYVGAGGIGVILNSSMALMNYERVSIIILTILITVAIVDKLSEQVRRSLA